MRSLISPVRSVRGKLNYLSSLGSTEEIARFLERKGHHGTPCAALTCPLSRYLSSPGISVLVSVEHLSVYNSSLTLIKFKMPLAPILTQFIREFDLNKFPYLEDR